jgi:transposase
LPDTIDYKQLYEQTRQENILLREEFKQLRAINEQLLHRVEQLLKLSFGSKSERYLGKEQMPEQLRLELAPEVVVEVPVPEIPKIEVTKASASEKQKKKHFVIPEGLVDEIQEIHPDVIPEGSKCTGSEVSYRLKCSPARLTAKKIIRYKYLLPTPEGDPGLNSKIIIAPLPDEVIKNCMADASLLATLIVEKYCDHLPVYRQMTRFDRAGIKLAHSTLLDWIAKTCTLLQPLYDALKQEVLKSNYLMMDETTMKVMDKTKKGTTHRGYFWAAQAPPENLVFFEYRLGRNQEVPQALLSDFKGYLQSDGYSCYETLAVNKDITLLCCMAHARRYFLEAGKNDPGRAAYALEVFGQLYDIEREIKDKTPEQRKTARQNQSKPIWIDFGNWLEENAGLLNEKSAIYKAFAYTMKRYKRLSVYMEDDLLNIDNNPIESSIRPIALGRRNFLFSGSHEGAQRSAMLYSFMGTCKLHGINPMIWMVDVLKKINNHPPQLMLEMLPHRWKIINEELLEGSKVLA